MLTSTQAAVLKAAITSDAAVTSFIPKDDWPAIAQNYNTNTTNLVWRSDITTKEVIGAIVGVEAIKQSAEQLQLLQILLIFPNVDATSAIVRGQFASIFPTSSAVSTFANLTSIAQRLTTKYENLFVSNQVSSVYGYILQPSDVQQAMS